MVEARVDREVQETVEDLFDAAREYLRLSNGDVDGAIAAAQKDYDKDRKFYPAKVIEVSLQIQIKAIETISKYERK